MCNNDACTPRREYVAEVAETARTRLAQQLHAHCDECESDAEYPADRALRRRVSAFQAMPRPLSVHWSAFWHCVTDGNLHASNTLHDERLMIS